MYNAWEGNPFAAQAVLIYKGKEKSP